MVLHHEASIQVYLQIYTSRNPTRSVQISTVRSISFVWGFREIFIFQGLKIMHTLLYCALYIIYAPIRNYQQHLTAIMCTADMTISRRQFFQLEFSLQVHLFIFFGKIFVYQLLYFYIIVTLFVDILRVPILGIGCRNYHEG